MFPTARTTSALADRHSCRKYLEASVYPGTTFEEGFRTNDGVRWHRQVPLGQPDPLGESATGFVTKFDDQAWDVYCDPVWLGNPHCPKGHPSHHGLTLGLVMLDPP